MLHGGVDPSLPNIAVRGRFVSATEPAIEDAVQWSYRRLIRTRCRERVRCALGPDRGTTQSPFFTVSRIWAVRV
jgi:hypothetical protein